MPYAGCGNLTLQSRWLGLIATGAVCVAKAGDEGSDPAGPELHSYLEASWNSLSASDRFTSGTQDRVFDTHRGLALQRLGIDAQSLPGQGIGGRLDLEVGDDAIAMAPNESYPGTAKIDLTQAYGQYAAGKVTVMAGKMITLLGVEYLQSPLDVNYSRSILFGYATPFTHIGVRVAFAPSDALTLYAGINNGWDHMPGANPVHTLELGLVANPHPAWNLYATSYIGSERTGAVVDTGPEGRRAVLDVVAVWHPLDPLTLTLNGNWARQENVPGQDSRLGTVSWSGQVAYASYRLNEQWKLSLRAERFADRYGYRTGVVQDWREKTATLGWTVNRHVEARAEIRRDHSDVAAFRNVCGPGAIRNQGSVAMQLLLTL